MTIIEKIDQLRSYIRDVDDHIKECSLTAAGRQLRRDFQEDKREACYRLGLLISNSAVKICLQSQYKG